MLNFNMNTSKRNTEALVLDQYIHDISCGDKRALAMLYEQTSSAIYGFALSIVQNTQDAEDVLQEVYVKIFTTAHTYQSKGKPMAWMLTITRNLALMRIREQKKAMLMPTEDIHNEYQPAVTDEDRMVLEAMLSELKDEERQIVILHSITGLKHREIATLMEIPLPTVLSKYNRALKKLRNTLKEGE